MFDSESLGLPELSAEVSSLELELPGEREPLSFDVTKLEVADLVASESANPLPATGVRGLLLAVLEDGIRCYFSPVRRVRAEAEHWVESSMQRTAFSFPVLCELFGIEPVAARSALRRLRRRLPTADLPRRRRRVVHGGVLA